MSQIEMSQNTIHQLEIENYCIIVFYIKNSLSLRYIYTDIASFHLAIGQIIDRDLDYADIDGFSKLLEQMELLAYKWIVANIDEYNAIKNPTDQENVVKKIFKTEDTKEIYRLWQYYILTLIFYNKSNNDIVKKQASDSFFSASACLA